MGGFDALSVRDLVALVVIASRTIAETRTDSGTQLVTEAFEVADAYVAQSEGRWASGAREEHAASSSSKHRPRK